MFDPPHPGEILKEEYMVPMKLTVTSLASTLGISRKNLSEIINEKTGISAEMAVRLSKAFNTSAELWMGMQKEFELSKALKKEYHVEQLVS
jgi:addiction module HigA family antidote